MVDQLHNAEAASRLARALAEDPLNARERRIILKYLRYAIDGPPRATPAPISPPVGPPRKGAAVAASGDQLTVQHNAA